MDKNAIKKFAIWARKEMLSGVMQRASLYGITENVFTRSNPIKKEITKMDISELDIPSEEKIGEITQIQKRQKDHILKRIEKEGFLQVMEEAACIWFLRIIAMQYLELNGFLSVFMETSTKEILEKKTFLLQCHALHSYLPFLFQEADEDLELLLLEEWFFKGRILDQMTQMIEKKDWIENVQMIGWLYQFYISEPKDVLINAKKQYKDKDVAYVTQIFTSDWIVKYMVENTLGRYWIEENHGEIRNFSWEYYLQSEF